MTGAATSIYSITEARKDAKRADARQQDANAIAAQQVEASRVAAAQAVQQVKAAEAQAGSSSNLPLLIGAGIAGAALLIFILKR